MTYTHGPCTLVSTHEPRTRHCGLSAFPSKPTTDVAGPAQPLCLRVPARHHTYYA